MSPQGWSKGTETARIEQATARPGPITLRAGPTLPVLADRTDIAGHVPVNVSHPAVPPVRLNPHLTLCNRSGTAPVRACTRRSRCAQPPHAKQQ